ncbi:MAG: universal stress protein, partial [Flavobacteriaceae bacterium]|nr:universal stress protein [Flavobacteriaceae bacterium]
DFFEKAFDVHHAIRFQNPHEGILSYAEKVKADLIVMGSKGQTNLDEILIGSNTEKVVRTADIPVLVVKKDNQNFKMKDLVFASSFQVEDEKIPFAKFLDFANSFKSKIHLVKINTPGKFESTQKSTEKVKEFIANFELPKHTINIYNDVSVKKGILNFARDIDADLIALRTHGRSGISHLFTASVTKNLSKNALKPMLTIKV